MNLVSFAGIVGDGGENAPNVRIGVVKRLRSDVGSNRDNARSRAQTQRSILTNAIVVVVAFRRCRWWRFHFRLFHRTPNFPNWVSPLRCSVPPLGTVNYELWSQWVKCDFVWWKWWGARTRKQQITNLKLALEALQFFYDY